MQQMPPPDDGHGADTAEGDTVSLTERIARRERHRARPWWIAAGIVVVLLGLAALAWFTPALALHSVQVRGAALSDPQQIQNSVMDRYRAAPLPQIRLHRLAADLKRENPTARDITVAWSGPHSLRVDVTDRTPLLAARTRGGWVRYDSDGRKLDTVKRDPDLPELTGDRSARSVRLAASVLDDCSADQRDRISEITRDTTDGIRLRYRSGRHAEKMVTIILGDTGQISRKMHVAEPLLRTGADTVDVSVPTRPVTK